MNNRLLKALASQNQEGVPVWLMRQAGRYMPEYQAIRKQHSLWDLFHQPELAATITQLPLKLLDVDAAILFSDILVIVEALGLEVCFPNIGGPYIQPPIQTAEQVDALPLLPVQTTLGYVFETIRCLKSELKVPLIGFCGGPFTVTSYCVDSGRDHAFVRTKKWMEEDPSSFHRLLQKMTSVTIEYLKGQIDAGVDVIQIFDSWMSVLDESQRHTFAYPYLKQIINEMSVPTIIFCRHSSLFPQELVLLSPSCISFDWLKPMGQLRQEVPRHIAVQGNLDPSILKRSKPEIAEAVCTLMQSMRNEPGYIMNLGHGVLPDIPFDHVRYFIDLVRDNAEMS